MSALTDPLTPAEREDFRHRFASRLKRVQAKTDEVFAFRDVKQPSFLVNGAPYWGFVYDPETFPEGLFSDPAVMTRAQERMFYEQICAVEDDFVPYLTPWLGTYVLTSAFGGRIEFPPKGDPVLDPGSRPVKTVQDIRKLTIPNPEKDGLMPRVLEYLAYMKQNSFLPVGITDLQGPLATANQLVGLEKLIYLMVDEPSAVHELMEKITESLIGWVKKQKEITGEPLAECFGDQCVYTGRHAGVWVADDDAVLMSTNLYREFVVPYNSRLLEAFGGGCLHYCGAATHQAENFLQTKGLRAVHNSVMFKARAFRDLRSKLEGRVALFACDLAPADFEQYWNEVLADLSWAGLIVYWACVPGVRMLKDGQLAQAPGDVRAVRKSAFNFLHARLRGSV